MIKVWRTSHEIADSVADALEEGLNGIRSELELSIGYGILRGNAERIRECEARGTPWFNIDRGYLKPGHFSGFYRVSLRGTQQTKGLGDLHPDYERLGRLQIEFPQPRGIRSNAHTLIIPPTEHAARFFGLGHPVVWMEDARKKYENDNLVFREKGCLRPLDEDLTNCLRVVTFNSSIGWEALRRGIPVYSDPDHSIVGAYQKICGQPLHLDLKARKALFGIMASLQLTLEEIKNGTICQLTDRLLAL